MATMLFFDDWVLTRMENVKRFRGKPKWVPEATLVDAATEGTWNFPYVWHNKAAGLWEALYCAAVPAGPKTDLGYFPRNQALMYARSPDGIHWETPDLRSQRSCMKDSPYKNLVFGAQAHIDGAPVFLDEREQDPEKRFKYLFSMSGRQGLAASPDGIRWRILEEVVIGDYTLDSPIGCFYNTGRQSYCITRRLHCGDRRVAFIETKDFKTFSQPEVIIHPDPEDPQLVQFYGMPVYPYESYYIGLLWRLHCHPTSELVAKLRGPIDCSLAYSLDGQHFNRAGHDAFIPRNERGEHGGGCIYTGAMVVCEDQIRFYSGASKAEHFQNQELDDAALMLHTLRLDGFYGLESYVVNGRITTRTVTFTGNTLLLNVRAPHGSVRVQILNYEGQPVEGYALEDCNAFTGDELYWQPTWRSGKQISDLADKGQYFLDIQLISAEIYAIRGDFYMNYGWGADQAPVRFAI